MTQQDACSARPGQRKSSGAHVSVQGVGLAPVLPNAAVAARALLKEITVLDRPIWLLAAVRAANTMGLSLVLTFFGVYIVTERGKSGLFYGALMVAAYLCQSIAQAFAGELSDRLGRLRIMAASLVLRALVLAALGLLIHMDAPIGWMVPAIVLSNILRGFFEPVSYAFVSDVARESERALAFSLQRVGTNVGWAIGPVTGGFLSELLSFGTIFFVSAPALLVSSWLVLRLREVPDETPRIAEGRDGLLAAWKQALAERTSLGFLACAALYSLGHGQIFTTLSIFMTGRLDLSKADVGRVFVCNAVFVLVLQIAVVSWIQKAGPRRALVLGSGLITVAMASCGFFSTVAGLALVMTLYTWGEVLVAPSQQALAAELSQGGRTGRAFGLLGQAQMLGVACAPLVGGAAYDLLPLPWLLWGALSLVPLTMTLGYGWLSKRPPAHR